jgi:hypothetical protein
MLRVTHIFGPMAETDVSMATPRTPERIFYAPAPTGVPAPFPNGYMQVGWNEIAPHEAWPGQVEYVLDRERSNLRPHQEYEDMEEGLAVYVLAGNPR